MSDLVKKLRTSMWEPDYGGCENCAGAERAEAADRIEALETALREIIDSYEYEASMDNPALLRARAVLTSSPADQPPAAS